MIYLTLVVALLTTLAAILLLRPLSRKIGLVDKPGGRKTHSMDTPLIGGLGIYLGLLTGCLLSPDILAHYQSLLLISSLLLLIGLVDDFYPLPALLRMGIQVIAAWLMCTLGENQLISLGSLFTGSELLLGRFGILMTIFATVGVINAINMIDGMDGLSGGMVTICLLFMSIAAGLSGNNPPFWTFQCSSLLVWSVF